MRRGRWGSRDVCDVGDAEDDFEQEMRRVSEEWGQMIRQAEEAPEDVKEEGGKDSGRKWPRELVSPLLRK